jgi:ribosomal protein L24
MQVMPKENRALVQGVNLVKKHQRQTARASEAGIISKEAPIQLSNIASARPERRQADARAFPDQRRWHQGARRQPLGRSDRWLRQLTLRA